MERIIFSELLDFVPKRQFRRCVEKYKGNHGVKSFTCWEQFVCMCFAQLTLREGLRDIEVCLRSMQSKLYQVGLTSTISRSTLADANENRSSKIYQSFCKVLIREARDLYVNDKFTEELDEVVYVLDSTYISLCLSLFPWGQIGKQQYAGIKVHTLLDLRGSIPSVISISKGASPDNKMLDEITIEPGAIYVMDKAYVDFKRLYRINEAKGYFVVRFKKNINFQRSSSAETHFNDGILADQTGILASREAKKNYPDKIRKIVFYDKEKNKNIIFLTNNFFLEAKLIALLYKKRWQIEIFFKWIKQNLKIKKFYGTSTNAVETQIWIAISTYLIIAIAKKKLKIKAPLYQILHLLSISLFEKQSLYQALNPPKEIVIMPSNCNQLSLFKF